MISIIVNSKEKLSEAIGQMRQSFDEDKYVTVTIRTGKKRTTSQNAISHLWYAQVSRELREFTPEGVKNLCKLHIGLPILRADDEEFSDLCVKIIDPLPYESRVDAMTYMPVTSMMRTKQLAEYLDGMQKNYTGRVNLEFPEDK